jgi:hypothetical protein
MWRIPQCVVTALGAVEITDVPREEVVDVLGPVVADLHALVDALPAANHTTTVLVCERGGDWVVERITATHYCYDGESHAHAPDAVARAAKSMGFAAATCTASDIRVVPENGLVRDTLTLTGCPHVCDIASIIRNLLLRPRIQWCLFPCVHPAVALLPFKGVLYAIRAVGVIHNCAVSDDITVHTVRVGPSVRIDDCMVSFEGAELHDRERIAALCDDFEELFVPSLGRQRWRIPSGVPRVDDAGDVVYSVLCCCQGGDLDFLVCDV